MDPAPEAWSPASVSDYDDPDLFSAPLPICFETNSLTSFAQDFPRTDAGCLSVSLAQDLTQADVVAAAAATVRNPVDRQLAEQLKIQHEQREAIRRRQEEIIAKQNELQAMYMQRNFMGHLGTVTSPQMYMSMGAPMHFNQQAVGVPPQPEKKDACTQTDIVAQPSGPPERADGNAVEFLDSVRWLLETEHPCLAIHGHSGNEFYVVDPIALGHLWREHRGRRHKANEDGEFQRI